jgi:hypothetical protein
MAKWSHMVSSSKTPIRLPSLIIMLLTSLHILCGVTCCCHEGTMCGERETQSKISDCERENSKASLLQDHSHPKQSSWLHSVCALLSWTMKLNWKKNTKCSSWELFGMETMWSCHIVPSSLWSWPHLISPLSSSFLASITTLTCTHNCAEYITHCSSQLHSKYWATIYDEGHQPQEPGELHEDMVIKFSRPFVKNVCSL